MLRNTLLFILCLCKGIIAPVKVNQIGDTVIETQYGDMRGVAVNISNTHLQNIEAFRGIKYGTLLNGSLRFGNASTTFNNWYSTQIAQSFRAICPHKILNEMGLKNLLIFLPKEFLRKLYGKMINFTASQIEECLTLNVYMPPEEWQVPKPLPVMVFVHGESYEIGTGNAYDGSVLASYGDVIVITVNYRLGVLGFLNLNNSHANGNQALLDLLAVLFWVKDNIAAFHGDPGRVTLFGHGHGAALVNILLLSPLVSEANLVHRAILQSGSALSSWATSYDPVACAYRLADSVKCLKFTNDTSAILKCLKAKSAEELVNNSPVAPKYYSCMAPAPNGQKIFPYPVTDLLRMPKSTFRSIPVMMGVTRNEAYSYLKQEELENGISIDRKNKILRTFVSNNFRYHRQKIYEILEHEYSSWDTTQTNFTRRDNILQLLSDGLYVAPLMKMAEEHSDFKNTYVYAFGHSTTAERYHNWSSAVHGDELAYVFGAPLVDGLGYFQKKYSDAEKRLSASMMRYWTNFAKSGDPNDPENITQYNTERYKDPNWKPYNKREKIFMYFDEKSVLKHHYRGKQLSLWFDLIPKLSRLDGAGSRDPSEHNLVDAKNISSYDDFPRLMSSMKRIFPGHPPIPPSPYMGNIDTRNRLNLPKKPTKASLEPSDQPESNKSPVKRDDPPTTKAPVSQVKHTEEIVNSVPLSITVAVGCSLLFLNVILFTAVYYQRRRIQGLNRRNYGNPDEPNNDSSNNRQSEEEEHHFDDTQPKQSSHHHTICAAQLDDKEKPNIQNNPLYSVICKSSSGDSSHRCSYESVSTDSSSPSRSTSKKILPNHTLPSFRNDNKPSSSKSCSPKLNNSKKDGVTSNHVIVKPSNSVKDTITVV